MVGLGCYDAREVLRRARLVAGPNPEGPSLAGVGWVDGVVVAQRPEPGALLRVGEPVTVWLDERGPGSAGVREPRHPKPAPRAASGMVDEESDEAVG